MRTRDRIINRLPISIYKNTAAHDNRPVRRTVRIGKTTVFTGLKHQCVELARRWCVRSKGATFRDVDNASDMVSLRNGKCLTCGRPVRISISSQVTPSSTSVGDLLVWKRGRPGPYRKTGHVAIVVNVEPNNRAVTVAEQNGSTKNGHRKIELNRCGTRRALAGRLRIFPCKRCK